MRMKATSSYKQQAFERVKSGKRRYKEAGSLGQHLVKPVKILPIAALGAVSVKSGYLLNSCTMWHYGKV